MSEHIVGRNVYFAVFGALLVFTVLTVLAAQVDFGPLNNVIAMTIAVTKATLVILFFMHVRYGSKLLMLVVVSGFFWLAIMLVLTLSDYRSRQWFGPSSGGMTSRPVARPVTTRPHEGQPTPVRP
ncbi:MAG TPA: cytochrome C oxidase subunit IV family protein [Pyrinomonadaceae bacterium]|nr:cytochrome C oxidase subunit IV family protein [Pyrinomonadaceae bacterium]